MNIKQITECPTVVDGVHESCLSRSYWVLDHCKTMLGRGDSQQTILDFIGLVESMPGQQATMQELKKSVKYEDEFSQQISDL